MNKKPPRDPIATFEREVRAAQRVGETNRCSRCGEGRPLALIPESNPIICANCQREKLGKSPLDDHHPAGQANHRATTPIPANDHRAALSPKQYEWPPETWKNPSGSPLLAGAACIRGYCETNDYLAAELLLTKVEMLEVLDPFLKQKCGPEWWLGTEMERFAPKRKKKPKGSEPLDCYFCGERFNDFAPLAEHVKAGCMKEKNMNVGSYVNNSGQQERSPLLDARLFRKLQKKGVVAGKMISCRQVNSPKFKGLVMDFKSGTAKFSFLANFERWDIGAIVRQLGSEETDDWLGQQVRFIIRKGQKGGTFINVENPKKARH